MEISKNDWVVLKNIHRCVLYNLSILFLLFATNLLLCLILKIKVQNYPWFGVARSWVWGRMSLRVMMSAILILPSQCTDVGNRSSNEQNVERLDYGPMVLSGRQAGERQGLFVLPCSCPAVSCFSEAQSLVLTRLWYWARDRPMFQQTQSSRVAISWLCMTMPSLACWAFSKASNVLVTWADLLRNIFLYSKCWVEQCLYREGSWEITS